ncbi:MAG: hypothetical protein ACXVIY_00925 [Mucilaginibacter sp.]
MKAIVIAASIQQVPGSIAVTFRDVKDPENPNDFTLGGREPGIVLRFFGEVPAVEQAKRYTLHLVAEGLPVAETTAPVVENDGLLSEEDEQAMVESILDGMTERLKPLLPGLINLDELAEKIAAKLAPAAPPVGEPPAEGNDPNGKTPKK